MTLSSGQKQLLLSVRNKNTAFVYTGQGLYFFIIILLNATAVLFLHHFLNGTQYLLILMHYPKYQLQLY